MSEKYNVLIAEDDKDIVEILTLYLGNEGYNVLSAYDGMEAYRIAESNKIDFAILDIMMPEMNGYELTKKLRERYNMPILILSAKNADSDKILGLNLGADDYISKPFNPLEVVARVNSGLRRFYKLNPSQNESTVLKVGELELDTEAIVLKKKGESITLTATEFKILQLLMKNPGRVFTKVQLYEKINGEYFENDDNTMMVHMSKLRDKIEDDSKNPKYIKTIRGLGYKMEKL
ncbi:MAG: response regulator transcription factor [Butyrivibrio sp.]|nr:response regulator transcription factor [Butyrivibrio sp.]